jgi:hypothetical protein
MDGWALPVTVNTLLPVYILTGRLGRWPSPGRDDPVSEPVVLADPAGPGLAAPGIRVCQRCKSGSALRRAATLRAYKGAAGEKTSNKIDTVFKLVRYHDGGSRGSLAPDSLLSPITVAADRSEPTNLLVAKVS